MPKFKEGVVRHLREQKCWSQEQLASKAGVSVRTIQRAESGASTKLANVAFIAKAMDVEASVLIDIPHVSDPSPDPTEQDRDSSFAATSIPVVLQQIADGGELLGTAAGSLSMAHDVRGVVDPADAERIGEVFDFVRDCVDVWGDISITNRLRAGVELTSMISSLMSRGWWLLVGKQRHSLRATSWEKSLPWTTFVIVAARADDSIIQHRDGAEPVALYILPHQYDLS